MKNFRIIVLFSVLLSLPLMAQSVGTTSFEFLKIQYSARGAALAGNLVAVKGDVNSLFYNPATLSGIDSRQWTINYVDHLLDFQGGNLAYLTRAGSLGNLGIGLIYFNYGDFEETDEFGERTGRTFGASEFAAAVSLSNLLGANFDYGVNLKFIYSSLESFSASGLAVDAGIIYTIPSVNNLVVGLSLSNLGFTIDNYTPETDETLPIYLRFGVTKRLEHLPLMVAGSFNDMTLDTGEFWDLFKRFSLAGEFDVSKVIKLRLGYDNEVNRDVKPLGGRTFAGVTAGLGIEWNKFRLDYSYSSYSDLGSQNRLAISGKL
jgi:hypothetical protein